jgi:signal transduction histidine kinase
VLALAVLLGMRARSPYWLLTLNGLTLLPLSSFAIGYSTTTANGVPFQEYGWVLGLLSLLAAQTYPYRPASGFARWNSIRVRLVLLVSLVSAGLLLLLYLLSAFVAQDAFHLTSSFFFLMFAVWMLANLVSYRVAEDIRALIDGVEAGGGTRAPGGFRLTIHEAELFAEKLRAAYDTIKSQSRQAALAKLSAQVAHDIRSPLAALESAMADVPQLPEEKRLLISGAAGRIRDIAEDLLQKNRGAAAACKPHGPCALLPLIQAVLAEKRAQFGGRGGVAISGPENAPAGAGARVNGPEFCRILSNLVNNAVEALERGGAVRVGLTVSGGLALVTVSDDGKGIPPEVLAELGRSGGTYGKAGGSGLGLYHARTTAESWGGRLDIISAPGKGTAVTLTLPAVPLRAALLDDDALVRLNWTAAARTAGVELAVFGKAADLLAAAGALPADTPLYIDSELGGGEAGEHTAALLRGKGFTDITMATGHPPEKFASLPWLKVAGKEPPWAPRP